MHTEYWWGDLKERDHLEDLGERWEDNTKINLKEMGWDYGLD